MKFMLEHNLGRIYIIENDVNNRVYIGQTVYTLIERFYGHRYLANKQVDTKIYRAMNEIGIEHFKIRLLEECEVAKLNEREAYYICKYNSYNNGYNSTPGGNAGSKQTIDTIDLKLFEQMYNAKIPLVRMAQHFNCSLKTINEVRKLLALDTNRGTFGNDGDKQEYKSHSRAIVKYDRQFNAICAYKTMADAIKANNISGHPYYFIRESCIRGNIAYGFRWQYEDELRFELKGKQEHFNTIFDKQLYNEGNTNIFKNNKGLYQILGIDYTKYVGNSAAPICDKCGKQIINGKCMCGVSISNDKENKREQMIIEIKQMVSQGMSLVDAGKKLGMSSNGVKGYCKRYGIDYKSSQSLIRTDYFKVIHHKYNVYAVLNAEEAYKLFIQCGIMSSSTVYNLYNRLKVAADKNKEIYGFSIERADEKQIIIPDNFIKSITKQERIHFIKSGVDIVFNSWEEVYRYLVSMGLTTTDVRSAKQGIKQSIKQRNGNRFGGKWYID